MVCVDKLTNLYVHYSVCTEFPLCSPALNTCCKAIKNHGCSGTAKKTFATPPQVGRDLQKFLAKYNTLLYTNCAASTCIILKQPYMCFFTENHQFCLQIVSKTRDSTDWCRYTLPTIYTCMCCG